MTDDEARAILKGRMTGSWINWNDSKDCPHWDSQGEPMITLDGEFTEQQLLAVLHFKKP
jgi:hypothetical protein